MMQLANDKFSYPVVLPKEDPRIPDCYGVTVNLRDGTEYKLESISHVMTDKFFEVVTKDEQVRSFQVDVVAEITLDKRWLVLQDLKKALDKKMKEESELKAKEEEKRVAAKRN